MAEEERSLIDLAAKVSPEVVTILHEVCSQIVAAVRRSECSTITFELGGKPITIEVHAHRIADESLKKEPVH